MKRKTKSASAEAKKLKRLIRTAKRVTLVMEDTLQELESRLKNLQHLYSLAAERNAFQMACDLMTRPPEKGLAKRKDIQQAVQSLMSVANSKLQ